MPPKPFDCAGRWRDLREAIMAGIEAWRQQPPKATLREIEAAVDERLAELRTRMLQDGARASPAANLSAVKVQDRPVCPQCGTPVAPRGPRERQVTTPHGQSLRWRRRDAVCPTCQVGLFPPG